MLSDTGRTDSFWIAGVTTAYLLAQAGRRVVVLEDGGARIECAG